VTGYRYGPYTGGPDPLAPPYDARRALDEMGDSVLGGADPDTALRELLRRGMQGRRGLDDMLRRVRERREEIRRRGRLDGILEQARALLDTAIGQERAELFPDPSDDARMREAELDSLPADTAQAISRLAGYSWRSAAARETFEQLKELLRRGMQGRRGLDDMLRRVREQREEIRRRGRLDGILEQARALLDTAIGQERAELFPDPSDDARMREAELDSLPADTAQAISRLAGYSWRSAAARETFEQLKDLLRREVLDSQFRGLKDALSSPDPEALQRVKDMLAELNEMLDADARGEHTQEDFDAFMERYGDMFPDRPANLEELVDQLARRAMAAQRLLASLSPEQRDELAGLMDQALADTGLAAEMARLAGALRSRRPDIDLGGWQQETMTGDDPLGLGDATIAPG